MIEYFADFHVHTVLSPCGDIIMTPRNIIEIAEKEGIDVLAITDHNSAENLEVALELAKEAKLEIIPGIEVESKEGIHLIALFSSLEEVYSFQKLIYKHLPFIKNDEDIFGPQLLTNQKDEFIDRIEKLLLISVELPLGRIVQEVRARGGIIFPAHIDKKDYSILTNLGFIPAEIDFPVLEISGNDSIESLYKKFPLLESYQLIRSSDAHYLHDLKPNIKLKLNELNLSEIMLAFKKAEGRDVVILD
jgi:hypothetical protein